MLRVLFVLFLLLGSCSAEDLTFEMAEFDQAYLQLVAELEAGEINGAQAQWSGLEDRWQQLSGRYPRLQSDNHYGPALHELEQWMAGTRLALQSGNRTYALAQLEHARYTLMYLRQDRDISYYLDHLYNFQDYWRIVEEALHDPMLCLMEWNEVEDAWLLARYHWQQAVINDPEPALFPAVYDHWGVFALRRERVHLALRDFEQQFALADQIMAAEVTPPVSQALAGLLALFHTDGPATALIR